MTSGRESVSGLEADADGSRVVLVGTETAQFFSQAPSMKVNISSRSIRMLVFLSRWYPPLAAVPSYLNVRRVLVPSSASRILALMMSCGLGRTGKGKCGGCLECSVCENTKSIHKASVLRRSQVHVMQLCG